MEYKIPTYYSNTSTWGYEEFDKEQFKGLITSLFKYPGEYNFDEDYLIVTEQCRAFLNKGYYCDAPSMSEDFIRYWETEKEKCRNGLLIKGNKETWYVTRDYYMWLNFLPIYQKDLRKYKQANLYDGQYHTALYELLAELNGKHVVLLKKRQYAMSYYHIAKLINQIWFEEGVTLKLLAFLDAYIGLEGSWGFANEYRDFLNEHTAWYRPFEPDSVGRWQQRIKTTVNGKDYYKGLKGRLLGVTTQQSPTKSVGGASRYIIAEESGVNPTLDKTYSYAKAALQLGPGKTTGQFIAFGSVGDLKQCDPLKKFMLHPDDNDFFGIPTRDYDDSGLEKIAGLFIPVHWNLDGFTDKYGNTDIAGAKQSILELREEQKKKLDYSDYQIEVSQNPLTITEAFDYREESVFPLRIINRQIKRIEDGEYFREFVDLHRTETGEIKIEQSNKRPIDVFPVKKNSDNKEGVIVMYERPVKEPEFGLYYASVDPVGVGKSTTSESIFSIIVYKNTVDRIITKLDGSIENIIERGKVVCTWAGRLDDVHHTNERASLIIEAYNAWTVVESNTSVFINYMISKRRQRYIVPKSQMAFLRDVNNSNVWEEYGWKNFGSIFTDNMIPYAIQFLEEELSVDENEETGIRIVEYGVTRIPDIMLLKEMQAYRKGANVDRVVSFCALASFVMVQNANRGYVKRREDENKNLQNSNKMTTLFRNPFNNIGQQINNGFKRNAFKNFR